MSINQQDKKSKRADTGFLLGGASPGNFEIWWIFKSALTLILDPSYQILYFALKNNFRKNN